MKTVTRRLMCELDNDELIEAGQELSQALDRQRDLEDQKASVTASIKVTAATVEALARKVKYRQEERPVQCRVMAAGKDPDGTLMVNLFRTDTGELIERRPATIDERQMDLPLGERDDDPAEDEAEEGGDRT